MALPITDYADLVALIVPEVPGADEPTIRYAIRRAGRRFCEDTEAWQEQLVLPVVVDQVSYELVAAAAQVEVRRIEQVRILSEDDDPNKFDAGRVVDSRYYSLQRVAGAGNIIFAENKVPGEADEDGDIVVDIRKVPDTNADVLPDEFLSRYETALRLLSLYELLRMPRAPWSNPALAQQYQLDYDDQVIRARFEDTHEDKHVDLIMQGSDFLL